MYEAQTRIIFVFILSFSECQWLKCCDTMWFSVVLADHFCFYSLFFRMPMIKMLWHYVIQGGVNGPCDMHKYTSCAFSTWSACPVPDQCVSNLNMKHKSESFLFILSFSECRWLKWCGTVGYSYVIICEQRVNSCFSLPNIFVCLVYRNEEVVCGVRR